jgi:hypothetical protein
VPVIALGLRGDLTLEETMTRLPWCLAAGWGVVAQQRWASTPPPAPKPARRSPDQAGAEATDEEPSPAV